MLIRGDRATSDLNRADMGEADKCVAGGGAHDWLAGDEHVSSRQGGDEEAASDADEDARGEMDKEELERGDEEDSAALFSAVAAAATSRDDELGDHRSDASEADALALLDDDMLSKAPL